AERDAPPQRHFESRRVQHRQRRRILRAHRSHRRALHHRRIAGRTRQPRESDHPRAPGHPAGRRRSFDGVRHPSDTGPTRVGPPSVELEHAHCHVGSRSEGALHRIERRVPVGGSRRDLEGDQPRSDGTRRPRHVAARVYATFDGHTNDDYHAYVFMSDDYGQTWRSIAAGVPDTSVHKLREHPRNARLLFVGHERGVSVSIDGGASWTSLNLNMPNVPVDDLLIHPRENDLIVGTHGRSIWILDNISALEALSTEPMTTDAFLVPPARARLLSIYNPQAWFGGGQF